MKNTNKNNEGKNQMKTIDMIARVITVVNCMGQQEFIDCFGEGMGEHLFAKVSLNQETGSKGPYFGNIGAFICYLDSGNRAALERYLAYRDLL
jgi:hypothetical protein